MDGYLWKRINEGAPKDMWIYTYHENPDQTCKLYAPEITGHTAACAVWTTDWCIIVLPFRPPLEMVAHEEKHCQGWGHN